MKRESCDFSRGRFNNVINNHTMPDLQSFKKELYNKRYRLELEIKKIQVICYDNNKKYFSDMQFIKDNCIIHFKLCKHTEKLIKELKNNNIPFKMNITNVIVDNNYFYKLIMVYKRIILLS